MNFFDQKKKKTICEFHYTYLDKTGLFVKFIFHFASLCDLNHLTKEALVNKLKEKWKKFILANRYN